MSRLSKYRKLIVLCMDMFILIMCGVTIFFLSPGGNGTGGRNIIPVLPNFLLLVSCVLIFQIVFQSYDTLWRYAESREYLTLLCGVGCGAFLFLLITQFFVKRSISLLYVLSVIMSTVVLMLLMRFFYRAFRQRNIQAARRTGKRHIAIIGAGSAGVALFHEIVNNQESPYQVDCFFDDDPSKIHRKIKGVEIKGPISELPSIMKNSSAYEIILAIPSLDTERRRQILDICNRTQSRVKILPSTLEMMLGPKRGLTSQIRNIKIDDLLGRSAVELDCKSVHDFIQGQVVLVTGGGGSIGSELCRQIASIGPKKLIVLDIYENNAYDLQQELRREYGEDLDLHVEIASVRDEDKLFEVFEAYRPAVVFHAAAHKHVPLMEDCPEEAIKNNVFGTWNAIRAADRTGVQRFVLISTDKAVNPTNVMGATKRLCEMLLQTMRDSKTDFIAVRFGNVLGSNGSVIPLFQRQIENGGPVTITDKRIIRYFMTIPEAAQLVLQAGAMAKESEVFVLDMGEPVKILTLAENLIALSGFAPYQDIQIAEVGLRPGEKLYEELLIRPEELEKTANEKIFVEHQRPIAREWMEAQLMQLDRVLQSHDRDAVRDCLHDIVPSFCDPDEVNAAAIERVEQTAPSAV